MSRCFIACLGLLAAMVVFQGATNEPPAGATRVAPPAAPRAALRVQRRARVDDEVRVRDLLLTDDDDAEDSREEALERALASRVKAEFKNLPLEDCLRTLCEEHDIDLHFDEQRINEAGVDLRQPVNLKVAGVHLQSVLELLLEQRELEWLLRHEVLFITSRAAAGQLLESRAYNVGHLALAGHAPEQLAEAIRGCVEPDDWEEVGGACNLKVTGQVLVIRATQRMHFDVESLLAELEEIADEDEEAEEERRARDAAVTLSSYKTGVELAERLEKVLPRIVAPHSWEPAGGDGKLFAVANRLVVVQTVAVQRQIAKLISELLSGT
jgi:hypothetical protein